MQKAEVLGQVEGAWHCLQDLMTLKIARFSCHKIIEMLLKYFFTFYFLIC